MEALPDLMSYEEALDFLREKEAIGSPLTTAEWAQVPAEVRRRAFFSATLTSARVAEKMQGYIDEFLDQHKEDFGTDAEHFSAQGRSEFVIKMRELLEKEGFGKLLPDGMIDPEINDNDLRDLRSARRLQLIFDTQVEQACSYGQWLEGQDPDVLDIFPAQRFIRVRPVLAPRAYHEEAIDTVRRKDDSKFWIGLNRDFGLPYGPWGFNSGCGVEDVDRDEAEELGVIKPDETPKPQTQHFNEKHQQSTAGLSDDVKLWAEKQLEGVATFKGDKAVMKPLESLADIERQGITPPPVPQVKPSVDEKELTENEKAIVNKIRERNSAHYTKASELDAKLEKEIVEILDDSSTDLGERLDKGAEKMMECEKEKTKSLHATERANSKESLKFLEDEGMVIPQSERKKIKFTCNLESPDLEEFHAVQDAVDFITAIVPAEKLPKDGVIFNVLSMYGFRASHRDNQITASFSASISTLAHELAHAIDKAHPDLLTSAAGFLYDRTIGEDSLSLSAFSGEKEYEDDEVFLKDSWAEKGGSHYTGKLSWKGKKPYSRKIDRATFIRSVNSTEILAEGLRRLLENPVYFKHQDPEYFNFIKNLLKK